MKQPSALILAAGAAALLMIAGCDKREPATPTPSTPTTSDTTTMPSAMPPASGASR